MAYLRPRCQMAPGTQICHVTVIFSKCLCCISDFGLMNMLTAYMSKGKITQSLGYLILDLQHRGEQYKSKIKCAIA